MQHAPSPNIEMNLREQLLAANGPGQHGSYPPPPSTAHSGAENPYQQSEANTHGHMDPNVTGQYADGEDMSQMGKAKRELSTSKRAAQNRAAQRAFRQRKEGYIKKLEEQVKDLQTMEQNYRTLQNENYQLREYILNLQSRLLETQSDYPPAPTALASGSGASNGESGTQAASSNHDHSDAMSQLQAAAAQASDVRPHDGSYSEYRSRSDEAGNDTKSN